MKIKVNKEGIKKIFGIILISLLVAIISVSNVSALGVTPAKKYIKYTPDAEQSFTYQIINNEHKTMNLNIYATDALATYITFEQQNISIRSDEETKDFSFKIKAPAGLNPGENVGKIVIEEFIPDMKVGETQVYAKFRVVTKVYVQVPYPEKYIDVELNIADTEKGKPLNVEAQVKNLGTTDIIAVQATFGIYEDENKIDETLTDKISIARGEEKKLLANIDTSKLKQGSYSAIAKINYDSYEMELGRDFNVGEMFIEILDYTKYFLIETVNKFDIHTQSEWNKKIRNAYAKIKISNESEVADLKSVSYDLEPYEKKIITAYWDTSGVALGNYNANMTLLYENKSSGKLGQVNVVNPDEYKKLLEKPAPLPTTWIAVAVAVVVVNAFIWFVLRKRALKNKIKARIKKH